MEATRDDRDAFRRSVEPSPLVIDCALFVAISTAFGVLLFSNFGYFSNDDVYIVVQPSPSAEIAPLHLEDGRYLLFAATRLLMVLGLDILRDYQVFAIMYAVAFATFAVTVVNYLTSDVAVSNIQQAIIAFLFARAFMTHGFVSDLIAWKVCFLYMVLILPIMAACLVMLQLAMPGWSHYAKLTILFLTLNFIYQQATMAQLWLSLARSLINYVSARDGRFQVLPRLLRHVLAVAAFFVISGLGYIALTKFVFWLTGVGSTRPFDLADDQTFLLNLSYHVQCVIGLLDPSGTIYGPYVGGPVALLGLVMIGLVLYEATRRSWRRLLIVLIILGCLMLCSQNLENLLLRVYWPSARSSFYAAMLLPVLGLTLWLAVRPNMRPTILVIAFVAINLQAAMFAKLTAERFELQRRDFVLAREISNAILADVTLADTSGISFPRHVPSTQYRGLTSSVLDSGQSAFDSLWSQAPVIDFVTGLKLTRVGVAACPLSMRRDLIRVHVRREGTGIVVCY